MGLKNWIDKAAERVFKHVTDAKVRALYHRAKSDPELARQLKDIEDNTTSMKQHLKQMQDLLQDD